MLFYRYLWKRGKLISSNRFDYLWFLSLFNPQTLTPPPLKKDNRISAPRSKSSRKRSRQKSTGRLHPRSSRGIFHSHSRRKDLSLCTWFWPNGRKRSWEEIVVFGRFEEAKGMFPLSLLCPCPPYSPPLHLFFFFQYTHQAYTPLLGRNGKHPSNPTNQNPELSSLYYETGWCGGERDILT